LASDGRSWCQTRALMAARRGECRLRQVHARRSKEPSRVRASMPNDLPDILPRFSQPNAMMWSTRSRQNSSQNALRTSSIRTMPKFFVEEQRKPGRHRRRRSLPKRSSGAKAENKLRSERFRRFWTNDTSGLSAIGRFRRDSPTSMTLLMTAEFGCDLFPANTRSLRSA